MKSYEFIKFSTELSTFLSSCTVKWSGMATLVNNLLSASGYTIPDDMREWKYYLNLMGDYHSTNESMTILSLDTQQEISFTKEVLLKHPLTLAAYRAGTSYYISLLEKYPNNSDLIRCIVYTPDLTIDELVATEDFSLIGYGTDILDSYEFQPAIQTLRKNLDYVKNHVYREVLSFDEYYPHTFWACMWVGLLSSLYAMRTENVKTSYMHNYYLWEYLKSYGISDYSDVLSRSQAEWLCRNINYIQMNQGTQHVLLLLANNLLSEAGMALVARVIYHHTYNNPDLLWQGEFISDVLPTDYADLADTSSVDTMTTMSTRLYTAGYDIDNSASHIADQSTIVDSTPHNILPTKVIELRPLSMYKRFSNVMARYLLDTLYRTMVDGKYAPTYEATDYTSAVSIDLTGIDIMHLITFCMLKSVGQTPVYVPRYYSPLLGTKVYTIPELDETLDFKDRTFKLDFLIDSAELLGSTWYGTNTIYKKPAQYSAVVSNMFVDVVTLMMTYQANHQPWEKHAIYYLRSKMMDGSVVTLPAANTLQTYAEWLDLNGLTSLVTSYDNHSDARTLYDDLATALFAYVIPQTPIMTKYLLDTDRTKTYDKLVQLMKELCSYNVLFLNGDSTTQNWVGYNPDTLDSENVSFTTEINTSGVCSGYIENMTMIRTDDAYLDTASLDKELSVLTVTHHDPGTFNTEIKDITFRKDITSTVSSNARVGNITSKIVIRVNIPDTTLEPM